VTRPIRRIGAVLSLLFLAILINLTVIQVFQAHDIRARSGNTRILLQDYRKQRGPIVVGSIPVADSIPTTDQLKYLREYQFGPMYASATGYFSMVYGATGLERIENDLLSGNDPRLFVNRVGQLIAGRTPQGGAVVLTLNAKAQAVAFRDLAGKIGAVAAIDPATGAILALVQSPSFDPALLSSHDPAAIRNYYDKLIKDPTQPLLNRPLVALDPPGSTFKLVTLAAALESGRYNKDSVIPGPAALNPFATQRFCCRLRPERPHHPRQCAHHLLQHRLCLARHAGRWRCATSRGREVRLQQQLQRPAAFGHQSLPDDP
jgi:peptidoglycan glycosyltransferase